MPVKPGAPGAPVETPGMYCSHFPDGDQAARTKVSEAFLPPPDSPFYRRSEPA